MIVVDVSCQTLRRARRRAPVHRRRRRELSIVGRGARERRARARGRRRRSTGAGRRRRTCIALRGPARARSRGLETVPANWRSSTACDSRSSFWPLCSTVGGTPVKPSTRGAWRVKMASPFSFSKFSSGTSVVSSTSKSLLFRKRTVSCSNRQTRRVPSQVGQVDASVAAAGGTAHPPVEAARTLRADHHHAHTQVGPGCWAPVVIPSAE